MFKETILRIRFFNRKVATWLVGYLKKTKITPNQISVFRLLVFIPLLAFFFSRGSYLFNLVASFLFFFFQVLDSVDGQLARLKNLTSDFGALLEQLGDRLNIMVVFISLTFGLYRRTQEVGIFLVGFWLLFVDNLQYMIILKRGELGLKINQDQRQRIRRRLAKKKLAPWESLVFNLTYLKDSPLVFFFTKIYPLFLGIILDRVQAAFIYMVAAASIQVLAAGYLSLDSVRKKPFLKVVDLIHRQTRRFRK
ncbi:MAG: CDP-alcohol phosphatidyltransferase family protein [Candidatus Pacebacteria bacterium]|nr:CDP-alcohol phosphatidyltransferase family protein [Candidatus Paceibacterota bacterium]